MTDTPPAGPNKPLRLALIGAVVLGTAAIFAYVAGWLDPQRLTPDTVIDTLEHNSGIYPGFRRNHAKGLCVTGHFDSNGALAELSRASLFSVGRVPVVGRLAIPGGNPRASDGAAPIRSLALRFLPDDGQEWRTGMNAMPVFVVRDVASFHALQKATAPQPGSGKPDPEKAAAFFKAHPETQAFRDWAKSSTPTSSYANSAYYSLNAFYLVDREGRERPVRWSVQPEAAVEPLAADKRGDADFLAAELAQRIAAGPLRWHLRFTLGEPGDSTADATQAWPASRRQVDAGELVIERLQPEIGGDCRDVNYDPLILPDGIRASDDPLLSARSAAYSESFNRRTREQAQEAH
ncbi:catalase family peroxidase [Pseudomonas sp. ZM23]|uniref:Catalase-related peroxidase n=1 Tax=Pseudomonas triclosanedens TaxID=2961893 RepID=A0ABY7A541_9PSED|nr:catalase family peroxidase [Pseudomonas triclosanedens]MCP8466371.1 catalase family peroxidase [Pseudomonas triclosanedens]MCP8471897.1 catalase family peroxidase [Pseudomonas triclosanedens]MCP8478592.1 catalase family peroxidase [Pseudomonas triclosanedens]WAI52213.1 catalase family peroxidase [Pseudomonas triclosanedens]